MNLVIEPVGPHHFEGLRHALDTVAREKRFLVFTEAPPAGECRQFFQSIIDRGDTQLVALQGGSVVGWCDVLTGHGQGQGRQHAGTLGIGLLPSARHRGIGAQLMRATIDAAWSRGLARIELTVRVGNDNAKALYERMGFVEEGLRRRDIRIDGCYHDSHAMALLRPPQ